MKVAVLKVVTKIQTILYVLYALFSAQAWPPAIPTNESICVLKFSQYDKIENVH